MAVADILNQGRFHDVNCGFRADVLSDSDRISVIFNLASDHCNQLHHAGSSGYFSVDKKGYLLVEINLTYGKRGICKQYLHDISWGIRHFKGLHRIFLFIQQKGNMVTGHLCIADAA